MQFDLDEERAHLKAAARDLLEKESPLAEARGLMETSEAGFSKALHAQLGELGYLALALPEEAGGSGMGHVGLAAVLEEMGRLAFPGPYLDLVMALEALQRLDGDEAASWLRRTATGEAIVVLAPGEAVSGDEPERPGTRFSKGRVAGRKCFVPFGAQADALLVTTREGLALVPRPDAGWSTTALPVVDHSQRFVQIDFDAPGSLLTDAAEANAVLASAARLGALGASALLLGLAQQSLETTTRYLMEREAFGTKIATFQALAHRAADMLLQTESTRGVVYRAAWAADHQPDDAARLVAVAKVQAGEAGRFVCGEAIQLHGGVGFTWEYDPHLYFKRVKTLEQFYGTEREQLELVLGAAGL